MVELIREFGLPTAMLLVVLLFTGAGLRWFAKRVVDPIVPAILDLIQHLRDSLDEQRRTHDEIKVKLDQNEEEHARILKILRDK